MRILHENPEDCSTKRRFWPFLCIAKRPVIFLNAQINRIIRTLKKIQFFSNFVLTNIKIYCIIMPVSCETQLHKIKKRAEVAELADAQASGACGSNTVWVQVPSSALFFCLKAKFSQRLRGSSQTHMQVCTFGPLPAEIKNPGPHL